MEEMYKENQNLQVGRKVVNKLTVFRRPSVTAPDRCVCVCVCERARESVRCIKVNWQRNKLIPTLQREVP